MVPPSPCFFAIVKWPVVDTSIGVGHFALPVADGVLELTRVLRACGVTVRAGAVLAIAADTLCGGLVGSRCQQNSQRRQAEKEIKQIGRAHV